MHIIHFYINIIIMLHVYNVRGHVMHTYNVIYKIQSGPALGITEEGNMTISN